MPTGEEEGGGEDEGEGGGEGEGEDDGEGAGEGDDEGEGKREGGGEGSAGGEGGSFLMRFGTDSGSANLVTVQHCPGLTSRGSANGTGWAPHESSKPELCSSLASRQVSSASGVTCLR